MHVASAQQLTPNLSEQIAAYETVLPIDARREVPAGRVYLEEVQAAAQKAPRIFLAGVTATAFDAGEVLSPAVHAALPVLYEQIAALIEEYGGFSL